MNKEQKFGNLHPTASDNEHGPWGCSRVLWAAFGTKQMPKAQDTDNRMGTEDPPTGKRAALWFQAQAPDNLPLLLKESS